MEHLGYMEPFISYAREAHVLAAGGCVRASAGRNHIYFDRQKTGYA